EDSNGNQGCRRPQRLVGRRVHHARKTGGQRNAVFEGRRSYRVSSGPGKEILQSHRRRSRCTQGFVAHNRIFETRRWPDFGVELWILKSKFKNERMRRK